MRIEPSFFLSFLQLQGIVSLHSYVYKQALHATEVDPALLLLVRVVAAQLAQCANAEGAPGGLP